MASCALHEGNSQSITSLAHLLVDDSSVQLLGWRTVFQCLMLAGDDGATVLGICESMAPDELINERRISQSPVVAAAYTFMRAPSVKLSDRLQNVRRLLSRLCSSQVCRRSSSSDGKYLHPLVVI
jgi:hypothetical protein